MSSDSKYWKGRSHIKIGNDVLRSKAWAAISPMSRALYVDLRRWMYSGANGDISATAKTIGTLGYKKSSLTKSLYELQAAGLLAKTRSGGVADGSKVCNLYRFTDMPVIGMPKKAIPASKATHDFLRFDLEKNLSVDGLRARIDSAMTGLKMTAKLKRAKIPRPATQDSEAPLHPATQDSGLSDYPAIQDSKTSEKKPEGCTRSGIDGVGLGKDQMLLSILPDRHLSTNHTYRTVTPLIRRGKTEIWAGASQLTSHCRPITHLVARVA